MFVFSVFAPMLYTSPISPSPIAYSSSKRVRGVMFTTAPGMLVRERRLEDFHCSEPVLAQIVLIEQLNVKSWELADVDPQLVSCDHPIVIFVKGVHQGVDMSFHRGLNVILVPTVAVHVSLR